MKTKSAVFIFLFLFIACVFPASALSEPKPFLWGNVIWNTGSQAIGIEVQLIQVSAKSEVAKTYTNEEGYYAFYGIKGKAADYSLQVYDGKTVRGSKVLGNLPIGGQAPDIIIK
ncbi:MAG: hypothetical protein KKC46_20815 [Proteobacteria bacterium]|nr:hypothetical protein [Pseudomonadota bacterium]